MRRCGIGDPVEGVGDRTIVLQSEIDRPSEALLLLASSRDAELFLGQCDAGHFGTAMFGKVERQTAPATSNIQHPMSRLHQKLCCQMPLLGEVRLAKALSRVFKIRSGVLAIRIEKEVVQSAVQIVVMRDVTLRI